MLLIIKSDLMSFLYLLSYHNITGPNVTVFAMAGYQFLELVSLLLCYSAKSQRLVVLWCSRKLT